MKRPTVFKGAKVRSAVLDNFRNCGRIDLSCEMAGVDRRQHYRWLQKFPEYAEAFQACMPQVADLLLSEVIRRGLEGTVEPVFSAGKRAMDYVMGADGQPITEPCPCARLSVAAQANCKHCSGSGKRPLMSPAIIRRYDTQCLLAASQARVPGFSQKLDHRLVDKKGEDRKLLETEAVEAWMAAQPDDWKNEA